VLVKPSSQGLIVLHIRMKEKKTFLGTVTLKKKKHYRENLGKKGRKKGRQELIEQTKDPPALA